MHDFEEPFQYVPWELSDVDLDKEMEDIKAIAELEKGSSEDEEEENEVRKCELFISQVSLPLCGA